jgi:signal transduction histidine kinase
MTLEVSKGSVRATIRDNGRGVNGDQLDEMLFENSGHLGLRGMRAATRRAGGTLRIFSGEDGGLTVEAVMPLAREKV